jgi:predicted DNA-binding transcriptional regulator AlpA
MIGTRALIPDLLTVRDVARRLSISERTVWRWTAMGLLPPPVHPHVRSTRWRAADIERYLQELPAHSGPGGCHGKTLSRGAAVGGRLPS